MHKLHTGISMKGNMQKLRGWQASLLKRHMIPAQLEIVRLNGHTAEERRNACDQGGGMQDFVGIIAGWHAFWQHWELSAVPWLGRCRAHFDKVCHFGQTILHLVHTTRTAQQSNLRHTACAATVNL